MGEDGTGLYLGEQDMDVIVEIGYKMPLLLTKVSYEDPIFWNDCLQFPSI
jgi:hypothetical protein